MKKICVIALASIVLLVFGPAMAEQTTGHQAASQPAEQSAHQPCDQASEPTEHETSWKVPELSEFHEVIYRIWHEAWPNKDVATLSALLPEVEAGAAKVEKAVLPGILRDKKPQWDANVGKLGKIVADYREAVSKKDSQKILDAAETLHAQFEALVRTIRPVMKEVDDFHQVLYKLYHYYYPAYDLPKIQSSAIELKARMEELGKVEVPPRLQGKEQEFQARRSDLGKAVDDLAAVSGAGKDEKAIKAAIEAMHDKYQAFERVF